jgi:hypothetical protein
MTQTTAVANTVTNTITPKLEDVQIQHLNDEDADTSYLGTFTDEQPDSDDLQRGSAFERRQASSGEYHYFVPAISVEEHRQALHDQGYSKGKAETMARQYCRRDWDRMEQLAEGHWSVIGIVAEATLHHLDSDGNLQHVETVRSSGLWGVESDSPIGHLAEIELEQKEELRQLLEDLDVDTSDLDIITALCLS